MKRIALVTYKAKPNLSDDDRLIIGHLQSHGFAPEPAMWDSPHVSWNRFAAIVLRSCWDYHLRLEEFSRWIDSLEKIGAPLWNLPRVVKWNMDKSYLRTLAAQGFPIAPSVWVEKGSAVSLKKVLQEQGWERAVIKPVVSAGAHQTWVTSPESAESHQSILNELLTKTGVVIQEFLGEVQTKGEWSFIFFNKQYSHAVLKQPKPGDFRVQEEHGGHSETKTPDAAFIKQAQKIVDSINEPLLYARVDAVERHDELVVMELELIEPFLFLAHDPLAPQRFAEAIAVRADGRNSE